jgi:hypothetical protein
MLKGLQQWQNSQAVCQVIGKKVWCADAAHGSSEFFFFFFLLFRGTFE